MVRKSEKQPVTRRKKIVRVIFAPLLILSGVFLAMLFFSPYGKVDGYDYKVIRTEIEIDSPVDSVFNYLGNSDNASEWSVFVSRIEPMNSDFVPDGSVGCRRRCYGKEDKTLRWDELTTVVEQNKRRQLIIYNLRNFPMIASGLATEQNYFRKGKDKTHLVFTVFYAEQPTTWETIKTYIAAYKVKSIFEQNLVNIKTICEGGKITSSN